MIRPSYRVQRWFVGVVGLSVLGAVGCFGTGKKNETLQIQPETKNLLNMNAQGKPQLPAPSNVAKPATFDPKQTGGTGINLKETFGRAVPNTKPESRPALPSPQMDNSVSLVNYNSPPAGGAITLPDAPMTRASSSLPTPKLDLPMEMPMTRNSTAPTGQPGRDTNTGVPIPSPTMSPLPMGELELPKPIPGAESRPRPPMPPADMVLPSGTLPKVPSATDGPIPGTKPLPLPPAEPLRPN